MLRTITALCGIRHVLFADAVLVRLSVSARAGADPGLEAPAAQYLPTGSRQGHAVSQEQELEENWQSLRVIVCLLLSGFQSDNDENWAPIHSTHAARVAHKVVQYRGKFCPHLREEDNTE